MKAWITLLTQTDYLAGVRTLHHALRQTQTRYPLVIMVTENIPAAVAAELTAAGCEVVLVPPLSLPQEATQHYASARFAEVWTKLRAWQFTDFERVVFLDADMLVRENIDELMEIALPENGIAACHACRCNPHRIASYPDNWRPENCFYHWQDRQQPPPAQLEPYFNSGMLVLEPHVGVLHQLEQRIAAIRDFARYPFPEQDLLNEFFRGRWRQLPFIYNALKTLPVQHSQTWRSDQAKIIHYILDKPWQRDGQHVPPQDDPYYPLDKLWLEAAQRAQAVKN